MRRKLPLHSLDNLNFLCGMWLFFAILFSLLCIAYCLLIIQYQTWFGRLKQFIPAENIRSLTKFSVIVPARNEAKSIRHCIESVYSNNYPSHLFEMIVVDDFSDDDTALIVSGLQMKYPALKLLQLKDFVPSPINSYKKKAIEVAVNQSVNDWIITTDADCTVPQKWLSLYDAFIQSSNFVFVAAPVEFHSNGSLLSVFQCLDFMSLQGIAAASVSAGFHSMSNGANLAYSKMAFNEVNGFANTDLIASGDDMLLMQKIQNKFPCTTGYLFNSDAVVLTQPENTWAAFFNQRIRWASKATNYTDRKIFLVLLLVYLFNFSLLAMFIASFFIQELFPWFLTAFSVKILCELLFMFSVAGFFKSTKMLWWFPLMQPLHIIYTVISGWLGKFGKYQWKGRTVK